MAEHRLRNPVTDVPRRSAGATVHDRRRRRLSGARPHDLPHLLGHLLHPCRAGALPTGPDPPPWGKRRRRRRGREVRARLVAKEAALEELDALAGEEWTRDETVEHMRTLYEYRKRRFAARAGKIEDQGYEDRSLAYQRTLQHLLNAQREALLRMRSDGELSNEAMNRILRELDSRSRSWRSESRNNSFSTTPSDKCPGLAFQVTLVEGSREVEPSLS